MPPADDPLELRPGALRLHALAAEGLLSPAALERALALTGRRPSVDTWYGFARVQLILLGTALAAVGAVFFVAANWEAIGPRTRMGLLAALMAGCTLAGGWIGLSRLSGRAAALAGGLLAGPLLALVGQTYQSGADAWELFGAWGVVMAAYALACRFAGAWALTLVLALVTLYLWIDQGLDSSPFKTPGLWASLAGSIALWSTSLALGRAGEHRGLAWLAWLASACVAFGHGAAAIVDDHRTGAALLGLLWGALHYTLTALAFPRATGQATYLRAGVGFGVGLVVILEGELIFDVLDLEEGGLLLMGCLLIAQGYYIGQALLQREVAAEEEVP